MFEVLKIFKCFNC